MINFLKDLFGFSLRSKVMKVIDDKISSYQKLCDKEIDDLNTEIYNKKTELIDTFSENLEKLSYERKDRKIEIENKFINNILNKII